MSYLDTRTSREDFIQQRGSIHTGEQAKLALKLFDWFCESKYDGKKGDEVIREIQMAIKQHGNNKMVYNVCNSFIQWLLEDHPEIKTQRNYYKTYIKKHNPSTIRQVIHYIRQYFEDFGEIELSDRKWRRLVKLPKPKEELKERFTKQDVRDFVDAAIPKRKALYMTLKDTAMRIGESVQLRKEDIDLTTNPATITIQADYTKTNKTRKAYVTRETRPHLEKLLAKTKDGALVFGSSQKVSKSVRNEEMIFRRIREQVGLVQRYKSNDRFTKSLHGFRAYCCTQLEESVNENFAHAYIGHKGYLEQYIRNQDKMVEKFLKGEYSLMVYFTHEVDELDYDIMKSQIETEMESKMQKMYQRLRETEDRRLELLTR